MPYISPAVLAEDQLSPLVADYLPLIGRGKVRNTFRIGEGVLGFLATDQLSTYDHVTGSTIPRKGEVLTAFKIFWNTEVLKGIPHDLVAFGEDIDGYFPRELRKNRGLWRRFIIALELNMLPVECVARQYLVGTGWEEYCDEKKPGFVCGHELPKGLRKGSMLPEVLFTPTTKSKTGHDLPLDVNDVRREHGTVPEELTLRVFNDGARYLKTCETILVDTKIEVGRDACGNFRVGDEVLTPDSSRFLPPNRDKQIARDYFSTLPTPFSDSTGKRIIGLKGLDPENIEHCHWAGEQKLPSDIVNLLKHTYLAGFAAHTRQTSIENFQEEVMGIPRS